MLSLHLRLTRFLPFPSQPAELVVGVLLTVLGLDIRLNPVIVVDLACFTNGLDFLRQSINLRLEPGEFDQVSGNPAQFWESFEVKN